MGFTVVGIGLIGGSMVLDIKGLYPEATICGVDTNENHIAEALKLGVIDQAATIEEVADADFVIVSVPVDVAMVVLPKVLDYAGEETIVFESIDPLTNEPQEDTAVSQELIPVWGELMARNWGKLRRNSILLGKTVSQSKKLNEDNFETVEKEFRSLSRQLSLLDTRIGTNPTMSGVVSVWESVEEILADKKEFEKLLGTLKVKQEAMEEK